MNLSKPSHRGFEQLKTFKMTFFVRRLSYFTQLKQHCCNVHFPLLFPNHECFDAEHIFEDQILPLKVHELQESNPASQPQADVGIQGLIIHEG